MSDIKKRNLRTKQHKVLEQNKTKENIRMPTVVLEAIEEQINQKDEFDKKQEIQLKYLQDAINSNNPATIKRARNQVLKQLIRAGILDQSGNLTDPYKSF